MIFNIGEIIVDEGEININEVGDLIDTNFDIDLSFYDDVESFMKYKEAFADGGWVDYVDYTDNYASCIGEELYSEQVLNFPKN